MTKEKNDTLWRLPSLRGLYIFEAAARHLNLVKAADELGLTQGALSRQISQLEHAVGVPLFLRHPRGLRLTEAGDILKNHCRLAFSELEEGIGTVSGTRLRQSLRVAVARSYATRVLSRRITSFVARYPWIDLILDGHRHLADLARNEADAAIRVGDGRWPDVAGEKIEDDPLFPVASPELVAKLGSVDVALLAEEATLLHYLERPYWETWSRSAGISLPTRTRGVRFSETVMMLEAAEAAQGIAIARRSLVREALEDGRLVRLSDIDASDGIGYYFCATPSNLRKESVQRFREWLFTAS
ncbi:LysR substrate-binding domain-containing protein [Brucella tritici]|uniref:LysR substrate-binding domain-containing protein n=1 Tax=Brucella tritici TaxID=94626 RepID=UPI00178C29FA|nr:LysR substrate-binding domain-containing protein [Brucella tritici]